MSEPKSAQSKAGQSESGQQAPVPLTTRLLLHQSLTARRAAAIIATVLMLTAIGFLAVIIASITASLMESSRRRFIASSDTDAGQRLNELNARLTRIEAALTPARSEGSPDGIS